MNSPKCSLQPGVAQTALEQEVRLGAYDTVRKLRASLELFDKTLNQKRNFSGFGSVRGRSIENMRDIIWRVQLVSKAGLRFDGMFSRQIKPLVFNNNPFASGSQIIYAEATI